MMTQKRLTPREELIRIQKEIFRKNRQRIKASELYPTGSISRYERDYSKAFSNYEAISDFTELIQDALAANIVVVSDYHTLKQSQKTFLKIADQLVLQNAQLTFALEFVQGRFQKAIEKYLQRKISESQFLKTVEYKKQWPYDIWANYRPLFDFARKHRIPIRGIDYVDPKNSLRRRDRYAAKKVVDAYAKNPRRVTMVLMGELHCAPNHLPWEILKQLKRKNQVARVLTVIQNSEVLYWKLAKENLETRAEVLKITDSQYCLMITHPIMAQQSYLVWLNDEEAGFELYDLNKTFRDHFRLLCRFLGIKPTWDIEEIEVFSADDIGFLEKLEDSAQFTRHELAEIKLQLKKSESYYIPSLQYVYLASISPNHSAEEASHLIQQMCALGSQGRWSKASFYPLVMQEALGFFGSKIINPKRKCPTESYFKDILTAFKTGVRRYSQTDFLVAVFVLAHLRYESGRLVRNFERIYSISGDILFQVTHALGYILGNKLYYGLMKGNISKSEVRNLYYLELEPNVAAGSYFHLVNKFQDLKVPKRI